MKCMIIDDEPMAIEILEDYVDKTPFLKLASSFRNPFKALDYLRQNEVELIFLDINMPDLTGIQFLNSLAKPPLVIFTTAYSEYALQSYDFCAVDYLLKPIEFDRFLKAANKALQQFNAINSKIADQVEKYILIKSGADLHRIKILDICYIKGTGNYVTFFLKKDSVMSLLSMKQALKLLPQKYFIRIHKSYIINYQQVTVIKSDSVSINSAEIPIGEVYKVDFLERVKELG